jgi:thiamine-monophosphate kinase
VTEEEIIAAIAPLTNGIGDDAALWQPSRSHRSAISTDMLVEGVDFTRAAMALEDSGWRAMAANLSDLAAMGARPVLATVALGLPAGASLDEILELYRGLALCAKRYKVSIAGGDLSRAPSLTIAIAVVGEVRASNAKMRAGGRPGDVLAVTGPLGAARAGLEITRGAEIAGGVREEALQAFRRPKPRLAEGRFLAASGNVTAMMDISDGLATDAHRLAAASGCGAKLEGIPVSNTARALALTRHEDPEVFALAGGEDFELLAAIRPRAFRFVATRFAKRFGRELSRVGVLHRQSGVVWRGEALAPMGWDHFSQAGALSASRHTIGT